MRSFNNLIIQIISGLYAALYAGVIISGFSSGEMAFQRYTDIIFVFLFVLYLAAFGLSWKYDKLAGIIFMVWIAGIWINDLGLARDKDAGFVSIMAVPALVFGALLMLNHYKKTISHPAINLQWKYVLRILLVNYAILYLIVVLSELFHGNPSDYLSIPLLIFPIMLVVFMAGFILSWDREFLAGIVLLVWCAILLAGFIVSNDIRNDGPWGFFGIPILLQGIFYIKNHFQYKLHKPAKA